MTELGAFLLPVVPLLLLVVCLLAGRYPGFASIVRIVERLDSRRRPATVAADQRRPTPPRSRAVGGGLLIAFGLAQRPPPLAP